MLEQLFKSLQDNKQQYLNAKEGAEFEERILAYIQREMGCARIRKDQVSPEDWKLIKTHMSDKFGTSYLDIPSENLKKTFIYQPYGSQEFPDFIIFTDKKAVPVEVKFSAKNSKPIWNSNVPRANAFYIFGSYGSKDITFFCGDDVVDAKHRESLYGFFKKIKTFEDEIRETMKDLDLTDRGFTPYIRAAFDQQKHKNTVQVSFFSHPNRKKAEDLALEKASQV